MLTSRNEECRASPERNLKLQVLRLCNYPQIYDYKGVCSGLGTCFATLEIKTDFTDRENLKMVLNLLYIILFNTQNNIGDRLKLTNFIVSKISDLESQRRNTNLYKKVVERVIELIENKPCDNFVSNFPELSDCQIEGIIKLCGYIKKKYPIYNEIVVWSNVDTYKFNTVLAAIDELFKPTITPVPILSLLKTYNDHMDERSFLRKHLISREGMPYTLRNILAQIAKDIEKFNKQKISYSPKSHDSDTKPEENKTFSLNKR